MPISKIAKVEKVHRDMAIYVNGKCDHLGIGICKPCVAQAIANIERQAILDTTDHIEHRIMDVFRDAPSFCTVGHILKGIQRIFAK